MISPTTEGQTVKEIVCWKCEEDLVGEAHPRFDPSDPWQGPITQDDYVCTPCLEGMQDAYLDYYSAY